MRSNSPEVTICPIFLTSFINTLKFNIFQVLSGYSDYRSFEGDHKSIRIFRFGWRCSSVSS